MMIAPPAGPGQPAPAGAPDPDPVVRRYRAFFALLDWGQVPERAADRPWPGRPPHPPAAYVKALQLSQYADAKQLGVQIPREPAK